MHASNSDFEIVPRQRTEGILAPKSPKTYTEPARVPPPMLYVAVFRMLVKRWSSLRYVAKDHWAQTAIYLMLFDLKTFATATLVVPSAQAQHRDKHC